MDQRRGQSGEVCLASCLCVDLIAARRADVEEDLAEMAAWMVRGEDEGEDWAARRSWAALMASAWACLMSGLMGCFFLLGGFESWVVLKDISAARLIAKFVQSRRMVVRLGEAGLSRECLRRGSVEERRVSYCC